MRGQFLEDIASQLRPAAGQDGLADLALHAGLLDALSDAVSISTEDGFIVYTNSAEDRLFGYQRGELVGKHVSEQNAYPEAENARVVRAVMDELRSKGVWRGEWINKRKDGSVFITSSHIMPIRWNGTSHWLCLQRDITGGEQVPDSKLALAAQAAELGIWDWDLISNRFDYSDRAKAICGFPLDTEVTYEDVVAVTHPDDFPFTSAQAARALDPNIRDRTPYEYRLSRGDGELRWVRATGYAVFGLHEGELRALRYVGTLEDITQQRQAREAERALADQLRIALDAAEMAVWRVDVLRRTLAPSPKLNALFGFPPEKVVSVDDVQALYTPGGALELRERWQASTEAHEPWFAAEFSIRRPDGAHRWFVVRCEIRYADSGEPVEAIGVVADITERRRAEIALRESDLRFREAANSAPAPVWMTNANGAVEFCNEAMAHFAGVGIELLMGDHWLTLIHPDDTASVRETRQRAWTEGHRAYDFEARFKHADGNWRWMHVSSQPRIDAAGDFQGYVGIAMDRTDVHAAMAKMRESEARFRGIFENAQVALWEEDFSNVLALLDGLRSRGVRDLRAHLADHPQMLPDAIARVRVLSTNPYAVELFEAEHAQALLASLDRVFASETTDLFVEELVALWEGRRRYEGDGRLRTLTGKPLDVVVSISFDGPRCERTLVSVTDISSRKAAERRLEGLNRVSHALAQDLDVKRIVQTATDAATEMTGAQFGAFFYNEVNEEGESYTLYTLSGAPREAFEPFGLPRNTAVFHPTFTGQGVVRSDDIRKDPRYGKNAPHHGMPKGHLPVASYLAVPVISSSGKVHGGLFFAHSEPGTFTSEAERLVSAIAAHAAIAIDNAQLYEAAQAELEQRRRVEGERELLINELNHRVKNTLATVQSLAMQSLRDTANPADAREAFLARLGALSRAHDLLTQQNWHSADILDVVRRAVSAFGFESRITIQGPRVRLSPRQSLSLALALHELGTNAIKHGALSNETGHVEIAWNVALEADAVARRLRLSWREYNGPSVLPPQRVGFGSRLINQYLARDLDAPASIQFLPEGVLASIECRLEPFGTDSVPQ
jgi:PAS domain S-box-containing protein